MMLAPGFGDVALGGGMLKRYFGLLLCRFGLHRRSRGRVTKQDDIYVSICKRCRVPMQKIDGKWAPR